MKIIELDKDISVFFVQAKSFPDKIKEAHDVLHRLVPFSAGCSYFDLSRPGNDSIGYRAATEEKYQDEAKKHGCEIPILKSRKYVSLPINEFRKTPGIIEKAFQKVISEPGIDPGGYCVE